MIEHYWFKSKLLLLHTSHNFINPIAYEYNPYITVVHYKSLDIWHMAYGIWHMAHVFVGNWESLVSAIIKWFIYCWLRLFIKEFQFQPGHYVHCTNVQCIFYTFCQFKKETIFKVLRIRDHCVWLNINKSRNENKTILILILV